MLKKIAALVQSQQHCVLATSDQGPEGAQPHASLMSCCAAPDLTEFWLATRAATRKCANLRANPKASLLFDDRSECRNGQPGLALNVDVRVAPFASVGDEEAARQALADRHPGLQGFLAEREVRVLRLLARRFQLLTGLTEVFVVDVEKMLDGGQGKA